MVFKLKYLSDQHAFVIIEENSQYSKNEPERSGNVMGFYYIVVRLIMGWYIQFKSCLSITKLYAKNFKDLYTST